MNEWVILMVKVPTQIKIIPGVSLKLKALLQENSIV